MKGWGSFYHQKKERNFSINTNQTSKFDTQQERETKTYVPGFGQPFSDFIHQVKKPDWDISIYTEQRKG